MDPENSAEYDGALRRKKILLMGQERHDDGVISGKKKNFADAPPSGTRQVGLVMKQSDPLYH